MKGDRSTKQSWIQKNLSCDSTTTQYIMMVSHRSGLLTIISKMTVVKVTVSPRRNDRKNSRAINLPKNILNIP